MQRWGWWPEPDVSKVSVLTHVLKSLSHLPDKHILLLASGSIMNLKLLFCCVLSAALLTPAHVRMVCLCYYRCWTRFKRAPDVAVERFYTVNDCFQLKDEKAKKKPHEHRDHGHHSHERHGEERRDHELREMKKQRTGKHAQVRGRFKDIVEGQCFSKTRRYYNDINEINLEYMHIKLTMWI